MALNAEALIASEIFFNTLLLTVAEDNYATVKHGTAVKALLDENAELEVKVAKLEESNKALQARLVLIEQKMQESATEAVQIEAKDVTQSNDDDDDDDDVELFGDDDEEDPEREAIKAQRIADYNARKAAKPASAAKSQIVLDVKPWDDTTPMDKLEECARSVECDGLLWGKSKLVEVGYGIKKLQITCVVEDDKCGSDYLEEQITGFEDYVQSVDVVSFQKL